MWSGSWKETYAATCQRSKAGTAAGIAEPRPLPPQDEPQEASEPPRKKGRTMAKKGGPAAEKKKAVAAAAEEKPAVLRVQGFYSDLLYQPWFCTCVDLRPEWLEVDNIDRSVTGSFSLPPTRRTTLRTCLRIT